MYLIPHSNKRFLYTSDLEATVKSALTPWGKRRTERMFARFLQEDPHPLALMLSHPFAFICYEFAVLLATYDLGRDSRDVRTLSSEPLTETEANYAAIIRAGQYYYLDVAEHLKSIRELESKIALESVRKAFPSEPLLPMARA